MNNEISPRSMARLTGWMYLLVIAAGVFAQAVVSERLINFGDAGKTAANILANETLYRAGFTVYMIEMTAQIVMGVLFYYLLKPVSRSAAMTATVLLITGSVIKLVARVFFYAPLVLLPDGSDQMSSLSLVLLKINDEAAGIALMFFGPATFIKGWLMLRSTFFPNWLGVLSIVGGIAWTTFYWPSFGRSLFMVSALVGLVGSLATIGWLIWRGLDQDRWLEQAQVSASSIWR